MKQLITFALTFALLAGLLATPAAAQEAASVQATPRANMNAVFSDCIQSMANEYGTTHTVCAVKELHDYADNLYYVCELEPAGYIIADATYGTVLEYSPSAPSPYLGLKDALVYLGPTYCYAKQRNGDLQNVFSGDVVPGKNVDFAFSARKQSNQLHDSLSKSANPAAVRRPAAASSLESFVGTQFAPQADAGIAASTTFYIHNGDKLRNLTTEKQLGYLSGGVCGYIATGLALYWWNLSGCDEAVNDFAFLQSKQKGFWGPNLTRELRSYGTYSSSAGVGLPGVEDMRDVIKKYAKVHSLTISYETRVLILYSFGSVKTALRKNQPVILFGDLYDPQPGGTKGQHAVLAYGLTAKEEIIAHYGWANYAEVIINERISTFGSSLEMTGCKADPVPMNDVIYDTWAYNSAQYCARYQILSLEDGNYCPNAKITRGDWVLALYTLAGSPEVPLDSNECSPALQAFTDINNKSPYYCAAAWAVKNGILTGLNSKTLGLGQTLKRQQAAAFLQRYSNTLGVIYTQKDGPAASSFSDYEDVSNYAQAPMDFCTRRYLIKGSDGNLNPNGELTRAQAGQLLYALASVATRTK